MLRAKARRGDLGSCLVHRRHLSSMAQRVHLPLSGPGVDCPRSKMERLQAECWHSRVRCQHLVGYPVLMSRSRQHMDGPNLDLKASPMCSSLSRSRATLRTTPPTGPKPPLRRNSFFFFTFLSPHSVLSFSHRHRVYPSMRP